MSKKRLVLVDVHALIHRAYHAYPPNLTANDKQINAVYGFTTLLIEVIKKFSPDYMICCADYGKAEKRLEIFKEYKATRKPTDKELLEQIPIAYEIIKAFGIPLLMKKGYEADDIIGTIINFNKDKEDLETIIVTGDKDLFQLVSESVFVYLAGSKFSQSRLYKTEDVIEKMGFGPEYVVTYKALRGDPSDNIPGVRGIGDKGAKMLIDKFGNLKDIVKSREQIKSSRLKSALKNNIDDAMLSEKLARIDRNVDIKFDLNDAKFDLNIEKVKEIFVQYRFVSLLKKLESLNSKPSLSKNKLQPSFFSEKTTEKKLNSNYVLVTKDTLRTFLGRLLRAKEFAFDTETTSLSMLHNRLVGISFSLEAKKAFYIPYNLISDNSDAFEILKRSIFQNPNIKKIAHNAKFDIHSLKNSGIDVNGLYFDTMLAAYIFGRFSKRLSLKSLAFEILGEEMTEFDDLTNLESDLLKIDKEAISQYACADADMTFRLFEKFSSDFDRVSNKGLSKLFFEIEMPLIPVLVDMERNGIKLSRSKIKKLSKLLDEKIALLQEHIYQLAGMRFNIASSQQLAEVLFVKLQLTPTRKTGTGAFSTSEQVLLDIREQHEIVDLILDYREAYKLRSTYTDGLITKIDKITKRIHTSFHQTIAATGRLSSSNPNLQNIPIASKLGRSVRQCFVPEKGKIFMSFDYSQQELRILSALSQDKALLDGYKNDVDVHALTASKLFNKDIKNVTKSERAIGKTVNFSVIYGISPYGLATRLKISQEEARFFIESYFELYPGVKAYFDSLMRQLYERGYVETLYGRRKVIDKNLLKNNRIKKRLYREVINFPIQGGAADMIKLAMNKIYYDLLSKSEYREYKMLLQIHDELLFEIPFKNKYSGEDIVKISKVDPAIKKFIGDVNNAMLEANQYDVPMKVDIEVGKNWGDIS